MTAPEYSQLGSPAVNPRNNRNGIYRTFKEVELLKAANMYQQFDKKGNIYENRLYAKTSINQKKLEVD